MKDRRQNDYFLFSKQPHHQIHHISKSQVNRFFAETLRYPSLCVLQYQRYPSVDPIRKGIHYIIMITFYIWIESRIKKILIWIEIVNSIDFGLHSNEPNTERRHPFSIQKVLFDCDPMRRRRYKSCKLASYRKIDGKRQKTYGKKVKQIIERPAVNRGCLFKLLLNEKSFEIARNKIARRDFYCTRLSRVTAKMTSSTALDQMWTEKI